MKVDRSLLQLAGRLFMAGLPGLGVDGPTEKLVRDCGISNFILFKRNVDSPAQLRALCRRLRELCAEAGLPPALIAIDQEGGSVTRLPPPFTQFPDARRLAESDDPERALTDYAATCARELLEVGINMNLAPVLDVAPAGRDLFMERRALGGDPATVARLGGVVIDTLQRAGVAACGKHFPGLGGAVLDPHRQLPTVDRSEEAIRRFDLPPFMAAVAAGVAAIMTSHTVYPSLDAACPATLSGRILTDLLRLELGYQGIIITDDLEMGAIENDMTAAAAAVASFRAGADLLLICHEQEKVRQGLEQLVASVAAGEIERQQLSRSAERITAAARRYGK